MRTSSSAASTLFTLFFTSAHRALSMVTVATNILIVIMTIISLTPQSAFAVTSNNDSYQCTINGKTTFSQFPCKEGKSTISNIKSHAVSQEDYKKSSKRAASEKKELAKIIKEQDKENAQRQKNSRTANLKHQKAKEKCEAFTLKAKWAKEDLKNTQPKSEIKAQIKLRRAQERADLACKK